MNHLPSVARSDDPRSNDPWIDRIARVCSHLDRASRPPSLSALARSCGVSASHFQRTFTRIVGVSPREYVEARRLARVKQGLRAAESVTSAMLDAGYRSTSRFYEGAARRIGMSPTTYRRGGASAMVRYLVIDSTLGRLLVAGTAKGICAVSLGDSDGTLTRALKQEYPTACLESANPELVAWARELLARLDGRQPSRELPVDVQATAFQQQVWKALKDIPFGETRTYSQLARAIGSPRAVRAVGRACATNPVAVVVPCHRVVPAAGGVGGYRWGTDRKRKLLAREGTILDRD